MSAATKKHTRYKAERNGASHGVERISFHELRGSVDGVNGALAPVDDVAGLAAAVLRILRLDAAQWRALSDGAARTVADSSWERSARVLQNAYRQLTHEQLTHEQLMRAEPAAPAR